MKGLVREKNMHSCFMGHILIFEEKNKIKKMVSIYVWYCTDISCRLFLLFLFLPPSQIKLQFEALNETGTKSAIIKTGLKNKKKKKGK